MPSADHPQRWDIFCTVVDNYGDIGVCWRLARQLVAEHGVSARLWVDDLTAFARLCPKIVPALDRQAAAGVDIRRWQQHFPADIAPADVVIEAFACELPKSYVAAMAQRDPKPRWINLEYLSAEAWVADCHGLPSPHPQLPLSKHFFIPGFDERSAGLLRERDLLARYAVFDAARWWATQGGAPTDLTLKVSLFAYENRATASLFDAWCKGEQPLRCLVTDSRVLSSLNATLARPLVPGERSRFGALDLQVLPFMRQEAYDDLLAACDLNFVRGEDSFVRAQFAARPLVWQAYRQEAGAHFAKLEAFLDLYVAGMDAGLAALTREVWRAWNRESDVAAHWPAWRDALPRLERHASMWCDRLAENADTASNLLIFCKKKLE